MRSRYLESHYFDCTCSSSDHTLRFVFDDEDGDLYTEVQMRPYHRWYQRIWLEVKYVFGYESKYGHWDCTMLRPEEYGKLRALLDRSEEVHKKAGTWPTVPVETGSKESE